MADKIEFKDYGDESFKSLEGDDNLYMPDDEEKTPGEKRAFWHGAWVGALFGFLLAMSIFAH